MDNSMLEKIYHQNAMILNKINFLEEKINNIESKINNFEEKINNIELNIINYNKNNNTNTINDSIIELKKEELNIDNKDVLKAISYRDYRSIIYIMKLIYKNKVNNTTSYPIKIVGKRSYEYFLNNKWHSDPYGHYITNTICLNIQNLFIKNNNFDLNIDYNDFLLNQNFIYKLSEDKYKKEIFKNIIEEIRIN